MIASALRLFSRYSHVNWALADQAMVSGVNFTTSILLARFLGLEEFGRFTLAWMVVMFANSIQQAVIVAPMMSIGPKQAEDQKPVYYGAVAVQQALFAGIAFVVVGVGAEFSIEIFPSWRIEGLALPLACASAGFLIQDFLRRYFFSCGRGAAAFASDALRYLGQVAVLIWLFQLGELDTRSALLAIAGMAMIGFLGLLPAVSRMRLQRDHVRAVVVRHWHFSKWLIGSAFMQWTSGQFFFLAAGAMLGATAVGALKAAQSLVGVLRFFFLGLENIVPVRAAQHLHDGGTAAMLGYLKRVTLFGFGATGLIAAVVIVAPGMWLSLLFGEEYRAFGYLLQWFSVNGMIWFFTIPLQSGLRAAEKTKVVFWASIGRTAFCLSAVYPLISNLDVTGVVLGHTGMTLIGVTILGYFFNKLVYSKAST